MSEAKRPPFLLCVHTSAAFNQLIQFVHSFSNEFCFVGEDFSHLNAFYSQKTPKTARARAHRQRGPLQPSCCRTKTAAAHIYVYLCGSKQARLVVVVFSTHGEAHTHCMQKGGAHSSRGRRPTKQHSSYMCMCDMTTRHHTTHTHRCMHTDRHTSAAAAAAVCTATSQGREGGGA